MLGATQYVEVLSVLCKAILHAGVKGFLEEFLLSRLRFGLCSVLLKRRSLKVFRAQDMVWLWRRMRKMLCVRVKVRGGGVV